MNKTATRALRAAAAALLVLVAGCDDGLTDANINRKAPTDVGPQFLLPQAIRSTIEQTFDKWIRFANSVRMRLAMRMSEVDPAAAQSAFVAAYNDGGFQSNADNAMLEWPGPPY